MPRIDPDSDQARKKLDPATPAAVANAPKKTPVAAPAVMQAMGLKPSDVSPSSIAAPNLETNPMPNTNPAASALGLGETDIAPGVSSVPSQPVNKAIVPETAVADGKPVGPVFGQQAKTASGDTSAVGGQDYQAMGNGPSANPVKEASAAPGFWQQALDVAGKAGKSLIELIGDFAAGYSHQQSSPTEQRLGREHELRMQGNQVQGQKDLANIQQGFQKQQADLDRKLQTSLAGARNDIEREKMKQDYQYQTQSLKNQSLSLQNQYAIEMLNQQLMIAGKKGATGGFMGLFGGE